MEGETLAARIEKGPIPLEQALSYATQIADALDRAHRAGVTHRDVKPANIMLTRDGVKVLDFGLAKSAASKTIGPNEATVVQGLTTEGVVLGTPQYMAPEQFEGREADARADIWAFGAVLYEMVTGQKAFQGKSYSTLVGAILAADPPPMSVKPFTPSWLDRLIRRCLAKDPEDRYHCMRDLVLDLRTPPKEATTVATTANHWKWATVACATLAIAAGIFASRKAGDAPSQMKLDVNPPSGSTFADLSIIGGSAISPNGKTLAFVVMDAKGKALLYLRPLDSLEARALPGTEDAGRPFWSPDSKSLGFGSNGKLKRIDVDGGVAITLCEAFVRSGTWSEEGVILFADRALGLQRISASGGTPAYVTKLDSAKGERFYTAPQFLPGGKNFLYMVRNYDAATTGIYWSSLEAQTPVQILSTEFNGLYDSNSGRLLYIQGDGALMARKLELNPPRLSGEPVMVAQGVRSVRNNGNAEFSISANGTLFHGRGGVGAKQRFAWWDRTGILIESIGQPFELGINRVGLSRDGSRVAYSASTPSDVWVMPLASGIATRVSFAGGVSPSWSPDGRQIYYSNGPSIYCRAADGSGSEELMAEVRDNWVSSVSPDGKHLLFGFSDILTLEAGRKETDAVLTDEV